MDDELFKNLVGKIVDKGKQNDTKENKMIFCIQMFQIRKK